MDNESASQLSDTIVASQPKSVHCSLNESRSFEQAIPNSCSTPNVSNHTLFRKRFQETLIEDSDTTIVDTFQDVDLKPKESERAKVAACTPDQADGISLGIEEYTLLLSSSEDDEEEEKDIESYYHLLDSPVNSDEEKENVTVIENPKLVKRPVVVEADSNDINMDNAQNNNCENNLCDSPDKKAQVLSDMPTNSLAKKKKLTATQVKNTEQFVSRSVAIKPYMQAYKDSDQRPYPKWLEEAKTNCTRQELMDLMKSIYDQSHGYSNNRNVLQNLTANNYRNALQFCGKDPNKYPKKLRSNFYKKPLSYNFKRFATK